MHQKYLKKKDKIEWVIWISEENRGFLEGSEVAFKEIVR